MSLPAEADSAASLRQRVLALVARIPPGRVMTYGQLALLAGQPGAAQQVGFIMNGVLKAGEVPWQRVINAQGRVSTHKLGLGELQEELLRAEGVELDDTGRCDLTRRQWWPDESETGTGMGLPERLL